MLKSNPKESRAIITAAKILSLRSTYFNNAFVYICRNLIHSKIFENGLCMSTNKECKNNPLTQHMMDMYWVPFAKSIVDSILCVGLVPFRYKKVDSSYVPYVPEAGTYEIHIVTDKEGFVRYEFFSNDKPIDINKPTPNAFVLSGFGYNPERNGQLNSTISCLYPIIRFNSDLHDFAIMAEKLRSNPPIIMQKKQEAATEQEEGLHYDAYIDSDAVKLNSHNQFQRDKQDIERLRNQHRLFLAAIEGRDPMRTSNQDTALKNMVPLPSQYSVGTVLAPNARTDFVSIQRLNQETICAMIGVPRSMIINDSVTRADIQGSHDVFRQTLIHWKKNIANILTKVYHVIYEEYEVSRLAKKSKKRKRNNLDLFVKDSMTRIEIPTVPYVSNDELRSLYLQGIISWKYYGEYMLRNASLPLDILKSKEEWSKDDRKEFMGVALKPPDSEGATKALPMAQQGSSSSSK
jgi:hypothetical protein